jgi:hypothetical protein
MAKRKRNERKADAVQPETGQQLSQEELQAQEGAELPDREAMSLVNANVAAPINLAAALNVLSDSSTAYANAEQTAPITQSAVPPPPTT